MALKTHLSQRIRVRLVLWVARPPGMRTMVQNHSPVLIDIVLNRACDILSCDRFITAATRALARLLVPALTFSRLTFSACRSHCTQASHSRRSDSAFGQDAE